MNGSRPTDATPTPPSADATVAVAYSGGRDSTALLHATLTATAPLGVSVLALHVHHGLNAGAEAWLSHCRRTCEDLSAAGHRIRFESRRLTGRPPRGASVEAWARAGRYAALAEMARRAGASLVLLAQHRRDQAETLLLQALRGAGVAGLAGMPRLVERDGLHWGRPWLDRPREVIEDYVQARRLAFVDDPSNADPRFARNRLRRDVWPALINAFPDAEANLAASAAWWGEAHAALAELAALDLAVVAPGEALEVDAWLGLSAARRGNALRAWLAGRFGAAPPASLVLRLQDELPTRRDARWPAPGGVLGVHRGRLAYVRPTIAAVPPPHRLVIARAGRYTVGPWAGRLEVARVQEGGVSFDRLAQIELRPRQGAEQFQSGPGRPPRSLKKQFQDAGIPAWQRDGPLVFSGDRLIFVPGLGLDARALAAPGEAQAQLRWIAGSR